MPQMENYIWPIVTAIFGLLIGSFLRPYLSQKGKNLATHEDIDKLVKEMSAITKATKDIEAKISDEVWNRQRQWELKRNSLLAISRSVAAMNSALEQLSATLTVFSQRQHTEVALSQETNVALQQELASAPKALLTAYVGFQETRTLALLVFGVNVQMAMSHLEDQYRMMMGKTAERDTDGQMKMLPMLRESVSSVLLAIRTEVGINLPTAKQTEP